MITVKTYIGYNYHEHCGEVLTKDVEVSRSECVLLTDCFVKINCFLGVSKYVT